MRPNSSPNCYLDVWCPSANIKPRKAGLGTERFWESRPIVKRLQHFLLTTYCSVSFPEMLYLPCSVRTFRIATQLFDRCLLSANLVTKHLSWGRMFANSLLFKSWSITIACNKVRVSNHVPINIPPETDKNSNAQHMHSKIRRLP